MLIEKGQIKTAIKFFYEVNQIMKGIYKDETNFVPIYNLVIKKGKVILYFYDENSLPLFTKFTITNEKYLKLFEGLKLCQTTIVSKDLFQFFKNYKSAIHVIQINEDKVKFVASNENEGFEDVSYECKLSVDFFNDNYEYIKKEKTLELEYITSINFSEEIIKTIYESKKLVNLIVNMEDETIEIENEDNITKDNLYLFMNKKFLNGLIYKVKHLKSGDKVEYSEVQANIYNTNRESIYLINVVVNTEFGIVEHKFIVSDFKSEIDVSNS